jgi:EmrB/QacA subfamily drug resistance transporter
MNKKLIVLLFSGVLMAALDIAIIGPALRSIQNTFSVDTREVSWIFSIYILMNLISTPLLSKLSDMFGRRWLYIISVFIFGAGSLVVALSNSFDMIILGRAIQGFGAGGIFPVATAVIGDTFPKEKQGSVLGWIGAVWGLAFIVGPIIGGLLLMIGWRWIFVINLPFALLVMYFSFRMLPSHRISDSLKFDWFGTLLLIVSLTCLVLGISRIDVQYFATSLRSFRVYSFLMLSLLLLPAFYFTQMKSDNPVMNPRLLRRRQLLLSYIVALGAGAGEVCVMFMPGLSKTSFGLTDSTASFSLLPLVLAMTIGAPLSGRLIDKVGSKIVILIGSGLLTIGLVFLSMSIKSKVGYYGSTVIIGFGLSALLGAPLRYILNRETSENDRAAGQGVLTLFTSTGQLIFNAMVGALIASLGGGLYGYQGAFLALSGFMLVIFFISLLLKDKVEESKV